MRNRSLVVAGLAVLALAGCHKAKPKEAELQAVFPTLPLPPEAEVLTKQAGTDAIRLVLVTPVMPDSIATYYRAVLSADPFHLVNDRTGKDKTVSLYAEREGNGPPLWVTVSPNGTSGSQVVLAGGAMAVKLESAKP